MATGIVDTHLHYWQWPRDAASRAAAEAQARHSSAPVEEELPYAEVAATIAHAGVGHALQVTRTLSGYDNDYSVEGTRHFPDTFRVCGRFDPTGPDLPGRLRDFMSDPAMAAIRLFWYSADEGWLSDGSMDAFWEEAETLDVPVCAYAPRNVGALHDVASRYAGLRLIVDHLGANLFSPVGQRFDHWQEVRRLNSLANVYLKVSALPEATGERFPFPAAQERIREVYEMFGPDRLMWGSNYPLTTRVCTYAEAVDLIRVGCDFLTSEDRAKLLGATATKVFGLPW
jgi:predicted TIM-barrel fold metal-dependent hydrolase